MRRNRVPLRVFVVPLLLGVLVSGCGGQSSDTGTVPESTAEEPTQELTSAPEATQETAGLPDEMKDSALQVGSTGAVGEFKITVKDIRVLEAKPADDAEGAYVWAYWIADGDTMPFLSRAFLGADGRAFTEVKYGSAEREKLAKDIDKVFSTEGLRVYDAEVFKGPAAQVSGGVLMLQPQGMTGTEGAAYWSAE